MAFREKLSWLQLLAIVVAFGGYFGMLAYQGGPGVIGRRYFFGILLAAIACHLAITIVGSIFLAIRQPDEAQARRDERDRAINNRAARVAYFVLLTGVIGAAASIHLGVNLFWMMNGILGALILGEAVRMVGQIVGYRRG